MNLSAASSWAFRCNGSCAVRFRPLELRDPSHPPSDSSVRSFGLMRGGCEVASAESSQPQANITVPLARAGLEGIVDGYFIGIGGEAEARDPVRWVVEAAVGGGGDWAAIGASGQTFDYFAGLRCAPETVSFPPKDRNARLVVAYYPAWEDMVDCSIQAVNAIGFFAMFVCGVRGRPHLIPGLWILTNLLEFGCYASEAIGRGLQHKWEQVGVLLLSCQSSVVLIIGAKYFQKYIIYVILIWVLTACAAAMLKGSLQRQTMESALMHFISDGTYLVAFAFAIVVIVLRRLVLAKAQRFATAHQRSYDEQWSTVLSREEDQSHLAALVALCKAIGRSLPPSHRQLNRRASAAAKVRRDFDRQSPFDTGIPGSVDAARPVHSLDQLYAQAICMEPILLRRVRQLALSYGGHFAANVDGRVEYVRYAAAGDGDSRDGCSFIWGRVKSLSRAIEKVVRIYDQARRRLVQPPPPSTSFSYAGSQLTSITRSPHFARMSRTWWTCADRPSCSRTSPAWPAASRTSAGTRPSGWSASRTGSTAPPPCLRQPSGTIHSILTIIMM
jgi:hypothetical protein